MLGRLQLMMIEREDSQVERIELLNELWMHQN